MKKLAIIGAGGHGKVVADSAEQSGWDKIEFFDDNWPKLQLNHFWPVTGNLVSLFKRASEFDGLILAIGNNRLRLALSEKLIDKKFQLVKIIHPTAVISKYTEIGPGTVVFAGSIINPGTKIGVAAIINTGATVDHDCVLGDGVHISPGAHLAGGVTVGDCSWIGIGSCVRQQIVIGNEVIIGAGASVVKNIPNGKIVTGVPAVEMR